MKRVGVVCLLALLLVCLACAASAEAQTVVIGEWKNMDKLYERLDELSPDAKVDLTATAMKLEYCKALAERYPDMEFVFKLRIFDKYTTSDVTELNLGAIKYSDVQKLYDYLEWMPKLTSLRTRGHVFTYDERQELADRFANITNVECLLRVGNNNLLSTCTAYCTKHALYTEDRHDQNDFRILKFCLDLKALDVGHNSVSDLEFIRELPQLQILIMADNDLSDLTPLESQTHLEYIELFLNEDITDISVLGNRPLLLDLHIGCCNITDFSALLTDTRLDRLWIGGNPVSDEQIAMLEKGLPNCTLNWTAIHHPTAEGWRQGHPRYLKIAKMFSTGRYVEFP